VVLNRKSWIAAAVAAVLAGCGGGGGGGGTSVPTVPTVSDPTRDADAGVVLLAVALFDGVAGADSLLGGLSFGGASGVDVLMGAPGALRTANCAGGGTASVQKVNATTFNLVAANCKPFAAPEQLVYTGTWAYTLNNTTYAADNTCAAGTSCTATWLADTTTAKFGYGTASERVFGNIFLVRNSAAGVRTFETAVAGQALPMGDAGTAIINGTPSQLSADLTGLRITVGGTPGVSRGTLRVTSPVRATVTFGAQVNGAVDKDGDGVADKNVALSWSTFLD
jgi:hypothetical protein